ncbi:MAG TPA: GNAT family N-acetyltransferase [Bacteroidia bacterium]|nr:GNAT family N-acetyltransferase [Bacteroidia bacterium]
METCAGNIRINDHREESDFAFVHREIAQSYWAKGIPADIMKKAMDHSICFNVFIDGKQAGFARVITDKATYAYLCDVVITESQRGKGLGKMLMRFIMDHPDLQGLRKFALGTHDAHGLYEKFGFCVAEHPERLMEIRVQDIYLKKKQ